MNYAVELAKQFRVRDNPEADGAVLGTVLSTDPLNIGIYNNQIILTEDLCYICSNVLSKTTTILLNSVADHGSITTEGTITAILNVGDKLCCLPIAGGQKYFIIDKVVG